MPSHITLIQPQKRLVTWGNARITHACVMIGWRALTGNHSLMKVTRAIATVTVVVGNQGLAI